MDTSELNQNAGRSNKSKLSCLSRRKGEETVEETCMVLYQRIYAACYILDELEDMGDKFFRDGMIYLMSEVMNGLIKLSSEDTLDHEEAVKCALAIANYDFEDWVKSIKPSQLTYELHSLLSYILAVSINAEICNVMEMILPKIGNIKPSQIKYPNMLKRAAKKCVKECKLNKSKKQH